MRKPAFCICENKGADQLPIDPAADPCLCFHYIDSKILYTSSILNFKLLTIFRGCKDQFVLDLVGNLKLFAHDAVHLV